MFSWYRKTIVPRLLNSEMGSEELKKIRKEVLKDANGTVLELGVGPGYNLAIYRGISKPYALEPSEELLKIAKSRANNLTFPVTFLNSGAEKIQLPDNSIDTVVSTWTLCSVKDLKQVLTEIARVLKPEGRFIFVDHGASPKTYLKVIQTLFTSVSKYFTGNCHCDRRIEDMIKEAGFHIQSISHPSEQGHPLIYNYQGIATLVTD